MSLYQGPRGGCLGFSAKAGFVRSNWGEPHLGHSAGVSSKGRTERRP